MLASKILSIKIEECAHVIYYLVYGRFASHSYIRSICLKSEYDFKKKRLTKNRDSNENTHILKLKRKALGKSSSE